MDQARFVDLVESSLNVQIVQYVSSKNDFCHQRDDSQAQPDATEQRLADAEQAPLAPPTSWYLRCAGP